MYIFGRVQPTTRMLSDKMGCRRGMRLTRIRRRKLIVNWGRIHDFSNCPYVLNRELTGNKLDELGYLGDAGVSIPKVYRGINQHTQFPILGRKVHHTKGKDIVKFNTKEEVTGEHDYYTKYIDKKGEYRVHVLGSKVAVINKKKRMEEVTCEVVWSKDKGWKQVNYREDGRYYKGLSEIGLQAIEALEYDFGAVDVIVERGTSKLYVLEVNTAPGLIERRANLYVDYFRETELQMLQGTRS